MGTNYYAITNRKIKVTCDCGFEHEINERLHIGKNSYGWMFALQCIPEKGIFELKDWMPILKEAQIKDEYDEEDEETLKDTVKSAHDQINEMNYAAGLIARGIPEDRIRSYGFAFKGKKVLIG